MINKVVVATQVVCCVCNRPLHVSHVTEWVPVEVDHLIIVKARDTQPSTMQCPECRK